MELRFLPRLAKPTLVRCFHNRPELRAKSVGDYYTSLLTDPQQTATINSQPPTTASPSSTPSISITSSSDPDPPILFSSRLTSPLERRTDKVKKSKEIAGVLIPPRPEEPDNCCMSGCVNCVWDAYRDNIEEWAAATKLAESKLHAQQGQEVPKREKDGGWEGKGGGNDGGGRERLWEGTGLDSSMKKEELLKGLPVGISEFMKIEKKLKEKKRREEAGG
ncbi:putative UPF0651 protein, mitochondrial [Calycina marina]|uniref:UPF0651 protein, mitochondrial n=1 Tax=Calycina marina TaxID=1763456 RepID=A0A9P8CCF7_9HELO|nr:putative UPF0651 protein, mitochondrial [Calycina marina]